MIPNDPPESLWLLGSLLIIRAAAEHTGGTISVVEHVVPRGGGWFTHAHREEHECVYVIDGHATFQLGERAISAPAGTCLQCPAGTHHAFIADGRHGARLLIVNAPAGPERLIRDFGAATRQDLPDAARLMAAAGRYGIELGAA
jgi:quercetin dioxygenase-like cupin family protein